MKTWTLRIENSPDETILDRPMTLFVLAMIAVATIWESVFLGRSSFLVAWDNSNQTFPWLVKIAHSLKNGALPLWDFNTEGGTSFIGENQTGPLYPVNWLLAALTGFEVTQKAVDLYVVAHFVIAALGMYLLLRVHKISRFSAMTIGTIFCSVGVMAGRSTGQVNIFVGLCWTPWVLACVAKAVTFGGERRRYFWLVTAGLFISLQIVGGHMQPATHAGLVSFLYLLFYRTNLVPKTLKEAISLVKDVTVDTAIIGVIAAMSAAPQLSTLFEYLQRSYRWVGQPAHPVPGVGRLSYDDFAGHSMINWRDISTLIRPQQLATEGDGGTLFFSYCGLIFAILGAGIISKARNFCLITIFITILMALGRHVPLVAHVLHNIPVLDKTREPGRVLILYLLCACWLAAQGLDGARGLSQKYLGRRLATPILVFIFAICVYECSAGMSRQLSAASAPTAPHSAYASAGIVRDLEQRTAQENGLFRIYLDKETLPPNIGDVFEVKTIMGYRATALQDYMNFLSKDWNFGSAVFNQLSAKYFVSREMLPKLHLVGTYDKLYLYENSSALPLIRPLDAAKGPNSLELKSIVWNTNSLSFAMKSLKTQHLVLAQNYFPGWSALVDGVQRPIKEESIFLAVDVPPGEHSIVFSYRPTFWTLSLIMCFLSLMVFFSLMIYISACKPRVPDGI